VDLLVGVASLRVVEVMEEVPNVSSVDLDRRLVGSSGGVGEDMNAGARTDLVHTHIASVVVVRSAHIETCRCTHLAVAGLELYVAAKLAMVVLVAAFAAAARY
jgi:hypothetical protein